MTLRIALRTQVWAIGDGFLASQANSLVTNDVALSVTLYDAGDPIIDSGDELAGALWADAGNDVLKLVRTGSPALVGAGAGDARERGSPIRATWHEDDAVITALGTGLPPVDVRAVSGDLFVEESTESRFLRTYQATGTKWHGAAFRAQYQAEATSSSGSPSNRGEPSDYGHFVTSTLTGTGPDTAADRLWAFRAQTVSDADTGTDDYEVVLEYGTALASMTEFASWSTAGSPTYRLTSTTNTAAVKLRPVESAVAGAGPGDPLRSVDSPFIEFIARDWDGAASQDNFARMGHDQIIDESTVGGSFTGGIGSIGIRMEPDGGTEYAAGGWLRFGDPAGLEAGSTHSFFLATLVGGGSVTDPSSAIDIILPQGDDATVGVPIKNAGLYRWSPRAWDGAASLDTQGTLRYEVTATGAAVTDIEARFRFRSEHTTTGALGDLMYLRSKGSHKAFGRFEFEESRVLTGALANGFSASLRLDPAYDGAFTVTKHNYMELQDVGLLNGATLTNAFVLDFDAAAGTHAALDAGTTKTTPGTVNAWLKVDIAGTIHFIPAYTSKTT